MPVAGVQDTDCSASFEEWANRKRSVTNSSGCIELDAAPVIC